VKTTFYRELGRSGIQLSALGLGCWAIGGPFWAGETPVGWGKVDDEESIGAVHRALELGVNFFDTADVYGAGHSERVLARALAGRRNQVVIATKFGNQFDENSKQITGISADPEYIRQACEASLRRLRTEYIDLYQFHWGDCPVEQAREARDTLETLVQAGKIRAYGWSTDSPERAAVFAEGQNCVAIQHQMNVLDDNPALASNLIYFSFVTLTTTGYGDIFQAADSAQPLQSGINIRSALPRDVARQASNARTRRSGMTSLMDGSGPPLIDRCLLRCMSPFMADFVAEVS